MPTKKKIKVIKIRPKKVDIKYLGIPNICFSATEKDDKREKELSKQRMKRGFDNSETWTFYYTIARFILPRLKEFRESTCNFSYPMGMTQKEWNSLLDEMIFSFQSIVDGKHDEDGDIFKKVQHGINLFAENFFDLWW